MRELTMNELAIVVGSGGATGGPLNGGGSQECSDRVFAGAIGGAIAGSSAGPIGAAVGFFGGGIMTWAGVDACYR